MNGHETWGSNGCKLAGPGSGRQEFQEPLRFPLYFPFEPHPSPLGAGFLTVRASPRATGQRQVRRSTRAPSP